MKGKRAFNMSVLLCALLQLLILVSCTSTKGNGDESQIVEPSINQNGLKVSSYIRTWPLGSTLADQALGNHWNAESVKAEYLTDLIVSFAHINMTDYSLCFPDIENSEHPFPEVWDEVKAIKAKYPHLKLHVSLGGWGADGFSEVAADSTKRASLVTSIATLVENQNLDGIDIDWEYPIGPDWGQEISCSPDDGDNFILLLTDVRNALDSLEKKYDKEITISIAVPSTTWYVQKIDVVKVSSIVDNLKLMSYDYYGSWSGTTGHHANLFNNPSDPEWGGWSTDQGVKAYLNAGVPSEKLIVGVSLYGRAWKGVSAGNTNGLYQKYTESAYPDGLSWPDLKGFLDENSGFTRYWDEIANAAYLYNGDVFITYTDEEEIVKIGEYVKENKLGGVMTWEYGHDVDAELLSVLAKSVQ